MSEQDFIILDGEDTKENEGSKDTPAEKWKKGNDCPRTGEEGEE